ncbi:unnamed protein product, partial [Polarella glacialis]
NLPPAGPEPDPSEAGIFRFPVRSEPQGWAMPVIVVDGELMEEAPLRALEHGVAAHLDIIIGGTNDENGFKPHSDKEPQKPDGRCFGRWVPRDEPREQLVNRLAWEIAGAPKLLQTEVKELRRIIAEEVLPAYEEEFGDKSSGHKTPAQRLQDAVATDFSFLAAVHLIAERLSNAKGDGRVFRYQFDGYGGLDGWHAMELEMLMGFDGDGLDRRSLPSIRRKSMDMWTAFARTGDPNTSEMNHSWEQYQSSTRKVIRW